MNVYDILFSGPILIIQFFIVLATATFIFDTIHYILHKLLKSKNSLLYKLATLHDFHHQWFQKDLTFNERLNGTNIIFHSLPELIVQLMVASVFYLYFNIFVVSGVIIFFILQFLITLFKSGHDKNHVSIERIPRPTGLIFVDQNYHSLHHHHPNSYYGSITTLFDRLVGTASYLDGKRVIMTGACGAFGSALKSILEKEGCIITTLKFKTDWDYDDYSLLATALIDQDILVLSHGSKGNSKEDLAMAANCTSFITFIEHFLSVQNAQMSPIEIWAVGSEIECHPSFGNTELQVYSASKRAYAQTAQKLYQRTDILYRHIVPSAFVSRMGPGLISAKSAARIAMFFIRRGFRYIPVTYTGIAFVNYFKFIWRSRQNS